ncbi:hypothetical protein GPECTOR_46g279 [Gonium pectorale]|uniref:Ribosomal protein L6 alpha-beta domain-containing protein n=1 Tax=Gonium pectorale TaxID=33097 RepID=A0A150GA39_GONPE|nr:hypothetical protein GPECTOR_46g279 [Gonium pectorale]|eukprot:KXZ46210.1 hypothetical protein GPECTOR_46g279 [Gonium pectorale]
MRGTQQLRFYRIPNRVIQPVVPYSERSGRPSPQPWPAFETFKSPPGDLRWHRSVVRFPAEVTAELQEGAEGSVGGASSTGSSGSGSAGKVLAISGKAGTIRLDLAELDPTGMLAYRLVLLPPAPGATAGSGRSLLVLASPDKARFEAVGAELNKAIRGVMSGYLLGLTVKGVGYRMEPLDEGAEGLRRNVGLTLAQRARRARDPNGSSPRPYYFEATNAEKQNVTYPHNKPASAVRLKVGYSRTAVYPLPPHIRAFFLKPTLMYLYGLELDELQRVAAEIRSIRKPNPYTGNGVQYVDEVVRLKARKGGK